MDEIGLLISYLLGVNLISFMLMGIDKQKAKKQQWRIPERTFWGLSLIGGAIGSLFAMKFFRHKTKHKSFIIGMPVLVIVHIGLLIIYFSLS